MIDIIQPHIVPYDTDILTVEKFGNRMKAYKVKVVQAVDFIEHLENLKKKSGDNPWPVIDAILNYWANQNLNEYDSFLFQIEVTRETRHDKKFAESKGGTELRYLLDIPKQVMYMIRGIYSADELDMNKEFAGEWMRRYPKMSVAEKR